jgi:DNA-binding MarR family transcriptional regulator
VSHPTAEIEQQLFTLFRHTVAIHVRTPDGTYSMDRSTYVILCLLDDHGPQRLGQIACVFRLDPSTITRQVQTVVRLGLAEKTTDPSDRRASILSLTTEGKAAVNSARESRQQFLAMLLDGWTDAERERFLGYLTRFNGEIRAWLEA